MPSGWWQINYNIMSTTKKEQYRFVYKGVEYDATDYAEKHPGGLPFLDNMKAVTKDFTEYFR
jgi:cytochrome b involved in lipid metabolism